MATFNKAKFKQVLHYIIEKVSSLENAGKTVIWKLLYFSDFDYYELHENSITGEKYFKYPLGPAPEHFDMAIKELKDEKVIKEMKVKVISFSRTKFISQSTASVSLLTAEEIKVIDKIIAKLSNMNARQISSYSHDDMPWKSAKNREELDYEMVFYRNDTMSIREYEDDDI